MINNLLDLARLEQGSRQLELTPEQPEVSAADRGRRGPPPCRGPGGRARARHAAGSSQGRRRRGAAGQRAGEPAGQRAHLHRPRRAGSRWARRSNGDSVTLSCRRHGGGHSARIPSARLRKVFPRARPEQGGRHRAGPGDRSRDRGGPRRHDHVRERARKGNGVSPDSTDRKPTRRDQVKEARISNDAGGTKPQNQGCQERRAL